MVKIEAIIRYQKLEDVQSALMDVGVTGLTVTEVKGMGKQKGITHTYRGSQYTVNLTPKIKLEIFAKDDEEDEIVEAILKAATTGEVGDGKIFVTPISKAVRIRTGERGEVALS